MVSKRRQVLNTIGVVAGIGIYVGSLGTTITLTSNQQSVDRQVKEDIVQIVDKLDRVLLAEGTSSFNKNITDLNLNYDFKSPETSLQMTGTFRDGYCIRVTNPGGAQTEKGRTYSVSSEGELNDSTARCNTLLDNAPVIAGPVIDESSKTEWEMVDTASLTFFGTSGLGALLGTGGLIAAVINHRKNSGDGDKEQVIELGPAPETVLPTLDRNENIVEDLQAGVENVPAYGTIPSLNVRIAEVKKQWSEYELDLVKILEYPAVTNMSLPATSDFHKAMRQVKVLMPEGIPASTTPLSVLNDAVLDLEHKFDVMISEAKRSKWSSFSDDERISLRTAQNLLSIAINAASSPNERQIAYKRLIREVEGILAFPEKALLELEARIAPEICESIIETGMATV